VFRAHLTALHVQQRPLFVLHVLLHKFYDSISHAIKPVKNRMKLLSTNNASLVIKDVRLVVDQLIPAQLAFQDITYLIIPVWLNVQRNIKSWKKIKSAFTQDLCVQMTITIVKIERVAYLQKELVIKTDMF